MTLVPIIYTSLIIFSALFFFVILVSYISYKAKTRGKLPKREVEFIRFSPAPVVQPAYVRSNNQVQRQVQVRPVIEASRRPVPNRIPEQYQPSRDNARYERKESSLKEQYSSAQRNENKNQRTRSLDYNNDRKPFHTRIEIMNETEKFKKTQVRYSELSEKSTKRNTGLSEMNLLHYYSDTENADMVSLNAAQAKHAM